MCDRAEGVEICWFVTSVTCVVYLMSAYRAASFREAAVAKQHFALWPNTLESNYGLMERLLLVICCPFQCLLYVLTNIDLNLFSVEGQCECLSVERTM